MVKKYITVIGAGKVGKALSKKLFDNGYRFNAVISRRKSSAKKLASLVKCKLYSDNIQKIPDDTKLIMLSAPDTELESIALQLSKNDLNFKSLSVFHVSGCLPAAVLKPLKEKGATIYSIHPFQTFSSESYDPELLNSISYGIEGDQKGIKAAKLLVHSLGGSFLVVPSEMKVLYHIAGVFASNYLITLMNSAEEILSEFVADSKTRKKILEPIIITSLKNYLSGGYVKSLTGPISRGDFKTIEKHLSCLEKYDRDFKQLYKSFGILALNKIKRENSEMKNVEKMKKILK